jgi:hypothetical protein
MCYKIISFKNNTLIRPLLLLHHLFPFILHRNTCYIVISFLSYTFCINKTCISKKQKKKIYTLQKTYLTLDK